MKQNVIWELNRKNFPAILREINDPPAKLFVRGIFPPISNLKSGVGNQKIPVNPTENTKWLCVVGSRHPSQYGVDACRALITGLSGYNIVIVSGLALGIDGIAHQSALEIGLPTVAVLGSGLDQNSIYPRNHFNLAKEILANGGALTSEFSENYSPRKYNFPERNRIMAGMSHATLIIEAGFRSGTLITARLAMEYNRDLLAVPGSIFSKLSEGPHMLISNGATPVRTSEDILSILGLDAHATNQKNLILENCSETERLVYKTLMEPASRAEILKKVIGKTQEISVAISLLEMKGFIIDSGGVLRHKK